MALRIALDLDGVLCEQTFSYEDAVPKPGVADQLKAWKAQGHTIIIHTARGMGRAAGNPALAMASIGALTVNQLRDWDFVYDELSFGKPSYDYFVDDKAYRSIDELLKAVSWT